MTNRSTTAAQWKLKRLSESIFAVPAQPKNYAGTNLQDVMHGRRNSQFVVARALSSHHGTALARRICAPFKGKADYSQIRQPYLVHLIHSCSSIDCARTEDFDLPGVIKPPTPLMLFVRVKRMNMEYGFCDIDAYSVKLHVELFLVSVSAWSELPLSCLDVI